MARLVRAGPGPGPWLSSDKPGAVSRVAKPSPGFKEAEQHTCAHVNKFPTGSEGRLGLRFGGEGVRGVVNVPPPFTFLEQPLYPAAPTERQQNVPPGTPRVLQSLARPVSVLHETLRHQNREARSLRYPRGTR